MDSDSSCYQTTYSEDERYEEYKKEKRRKKMELDKQIEAEREHNFKTFYETNCDNPNSIFNLPGVHFIKFCSQKIKFSFQPCRVAKMVSPRLMFCISFKYYLNRHWIIRRDFLPVNYKMKVYSKFYTNGSFRFNDENIQDGIFEIYALLVKWAKEEHKFRARRYQKYRNGEPIFLDQFEEELFLSDSEIEELHRKRDEIWQRMLPPSRPSTKRRIRRSLNVPV